MFFVLFGHSTVDQLIKLYRHILKTLDQFTTNHDVWCFVICPNVWHTCLLFELLELIMFCFIQRGTFAN